MERAPITWRKGSWNEDLLKSVKQIFEDALDRAFDSREAAVKTFEETLVGLVNAIPGHVRGELDAITIDHDGIKDLADSVVYTLRNLIREFQDEHRRKELNIRQDALQDNHSNFLVQALSETVYKGALTDKGAGWTTRWYERFLVFLRKPKHENPYNRWVEDTTKAMDKNHTACTNALRTSLGRELNDFSRQFERLFDQPKKDDPALATVRTFLKAYHPWARAILRKTKSTMLNLDNKYKGPE